MPVYRGGLTGAGAGVMLSVFDIELVKNTNWSIYDASAGTNAKVYYCSSGGFYVYIDDNYTDYYIIRMWETWDAGTHVGSGDNTPASYFSKAYGSYVLILNDTRFIVLNLWADSTFSGSGGYVGCLASVAGVAGLKAVMGATVSGSASILALSYDVSPVSGKVMSDTLGNSGTTMYFFGRISGADSCYRKMRDLKGRHHLRNSVMFHLVTSPFYICGELDGVCSVSNVGSTGGDSVLKSGEIVVSDGVDWMFVRDGNYGAFVRMI